MLNGIESSINDKFMGVAWGFNQQRFPQRRNGIFHGGFTCGDSMMMSSVNCSWRFLGGDILQIFSGIELDDYQPNIRIITMLYANILYQLL